jgi:hypothetical protein
VDGCHSVDEFPTDSGVYVVNVVKITTYWFEEFNIKYKTIWKY